MNKKVIAVIFREYITRIRTKGFIIGTLITPFLLVLVFGGIYIFAIFFQPSTKTYQIIDETGSVYNEFTSSLSDTLENGAPKYRFVERDTANEPMDSILADMQKLVSTKQIDGYMIIPKDLVESRKVKYAARSLSNWDEQREFRNTLSRIVTNYRLVQKGFSPDTIRKEFNLGRVDLENRQVTDEGEVEKSGASSFVLTYILTYLMFLMVMIYGQSLMRSVIQEKSERITETIVSSIKPFQLLIGKLVGISMVGLTQMLVIGLMMLIAALYSESIFVSFGVSSQDVLGVARQIQFSGSVFAFLLIFFLLGFIFYSGLYAAIGAMVNSEDEGQQLQFPVIILLIVSFFMMFTVAQNPETPMAFWTSLIPLFTPVLMFARIAVTDPILPDGSLISIPIMLLSTIIMIYLVSKIYRVGILMYGKRPSLKEVIKWIKYS
jgi:ABC-2 type transport system permease protein